MGQVVVIGGGPIGLASGMLLARSGHKVTVLERDPQGPPEDIDAAWGGWDRGGVAQFRQVHFMQPRFRHLLDAEFPDVREELEHSGGTRFSPFRLAPAITDRVARPGDERFETLTARRPVIELAFARAAALTAGVTIRRGVGIAGPLLGATRDGIPHVAGVRTTAGEEIRADLVVDAMGRRSPLPAWVADAGGMTMPEESSDAGFIYYGRHFRSGDGSRPDPRGPMVTNLETLRIISIPADNGAWTVGLVASADDFPMKALRDNASWERVVRAVPHLAHWLDGEPLCDVIPMGGVQDRIRRLVVEDRPVITGIVPVGDSWACTNPSAGRGLSLGLMQSVILRDTANALLDAPGSLALEYHRLTEEQVTPWFDQQLRADRVRAAEVHAVIQGLPAPVPDDGPGRMQAAFFAAAMEDADVARGMFDIMGTLALPSEVMARPGLMEKVLPYLDRPASAPSHGPRRAELVELVA